MPTYVRLYKEPSRGLFYGGSSLLLLFYYLAPLQNDALVMSICVQFTFGDKKEVYLLDESAQPVAEKESMQQIWYAREKREHQPEDEMNIL